MDYTTIFDVTQSGFRQWWFPASGLILLAVGLAMFFFRHYIRSTVGRVFAIIVPAFAAFWTLSSLALTASDYFGLAVSDHNIYALFLSTHYPSDVTADAGGPVYYQQQVLATVPREDFGGGF